MSDSAFERMNKWRREGVTDGMWEGGREGVSGPGDSLTMAGENLCFWLCMVDKAMNKGKDNFFSPENDHLVFNSVRVKKELMMEPALLLSVSLVMRKDLAWSSEEVERPLYVEVK